MKIEIPAKFIRGAMACCASNSEVREHLKGVFFDGETGEIIGTNGHVLYFAKSDNLKGLFEGTKILKVPQNISKKVKLVEIDFTSNEIQLIDFGVTFLCEPITAIPPFFRDVIDEAGADESVQETGINPKYITLGINALEALSFQYLEFKLTEKYCVMKSDDGNEKVIMLPVRLG